MIEVEVHEQLRELMRQSPQAGWSHQLTMARMVARGLRLERSALIQVPDGEQHRLSYLLPALMWSGPTLLCATEDLQRRILRQEIPWLQAALSSDKPVLQAQSWPGNDFKGLVLMDPCVWLRARLETTTFPTAIPLLIDGAEQLEDWVEEVLTLTLTSQDWQQLQWAVPSQVEMIEQTQLKLTHSLLQRPLVELPLHSDESSWLEDLVKQLPPDPSQLPPNWGIWRERLADPVPSTLWAKIYRATGQVTLHLSPIDAQAWLTSLWSTQPFVIMGEALDLDRQATTFRHRLGLPELTTLRFLPSPDPRQADPQLQVYLPLLPVPNSSLFRESLIQELKQLITQTDGSVVVLLSDQPLQAQVGAVLAAEFGSRVRVNLPHNHDKGILVCDWSYWLAQKACLPRPELLVVATLPFPSVEDPLVAGRVNHLQQTRQDWFRSYLLPTAAAYLQRAISPLRASRGLPAGKIAILDSRILTRSYGSQLLDTLGPTIRLRRP